MIIGTYRPGDVLAREHRLREAHQELQLHGYCHELALEFLSEEHIAEYLAVRFLSPSPAEAGNGIKLSNRVIASDAQERSNLLQKQRLLRRSTPRNDSLPLNLMPLAEAGEDWGKGLSQAAFQELARLLQQRTEGNPLFMVNVLDLLVTQGVIVRRDGHWELAGRLEDVPAVTPPTIRQFLEQQLDRLSPADQRLLEVASVAGAEFSAAAVAAGVGAPTAEVEEQCATLARRGQFLQTRGSEEWPDGTVATRYGFLHALYQEVLYERAPTGRRVELHRRLGARYESAYGDQAGTIATALAMHFERGREYLRAVHYLEEAGKTALRRNAHHEAIGHLTQGRELLQTLADTSERARHELSLQLTLGTALMATRGLASPEAAQAYNRARELCRQVNDSRQLGPVLWGLRTYYNGRAEFSIAREVAEQLLALAQRREDPALLVDAYRALGSTFYFQGEVVAAYEHLARGSTLYDVRHHRSLALLYENDPGAGCLCFAAVALWHLGSPDRALRRSREALQLAEDVAHPGSQAMTLSLSAALHQNLREVQTTRERAETLIALARKHGFAGWLVNGTIYRLPRLGVGSSGRGGRRRRGNPPRSHDHARHGDRTQSATFADGARRGV